MKHKHIALLGLVSALAACQPNSSLDDLREFVRQVDSQAAPRVSPLPAFVEPVTYVYQNSALRAPFVPPVSIDAQIRQIQSANVRPDMARPREPLESYRLEDLVLSGTVKRENGELHAWVRDPSGTIHRIRENNYIGQNHGQISKVSTDRIELTEIVPVGDGGWITRPQTITIAGYN